MTRIIVPMMISMLKRWELLMLKSYKDKDGSWHVGYGSGNASGLHPLITSSTALKDDGEATKMLMKDLNYLVPIVEKQIAAGVEVNDNQFNALLDVAYNRGPGTLRDSAVMWHVNNASDPLHMKRAAHAFVFSEEKRADGTEFARLNTARDPLTGGARVYLGLTLRRIDDAALFQSPME